MADGDPKSNGHPDGRKRDICPTCSRSDVSRLARFDEALDADVAGSIEVKTAEKKIFIRGKPFSVSDILATDPDAYAEAVDDWLADSRTEFRETIVARFPYPIAHHFFLSDQAYDSENSRLQHL